MTTYEEIEKKLDNKNKYLGMDENKALCFENYVQLTNETYKEIKEKLQILDILYNFLEDSVYGWNPKKETWGWIEFNLDIEKDDNREKEKKKLQEWIIKTHKEKENDK